MWSGQVDVCELYGSESKAQVYGHLHNVFEQDCMASVGRLNVMFVQLGRLLCPDIVHFY